MTSVFHKLFVLRLLVLCCFLFSCVPQWADAHPLKICKFDQIYQLGDSISDTGNLIREVPIGAATAFARLPYGETFFKKATGRCSNGLLMIDYIAMDAGLPFLPPYKNLDAADFEHGVNFAVAGSTHCLRLFEKLPKCSVHGWRNGGNDYNYAIFQGKTMEELRSMVPDVVATIVDAARKVIEVGGKRVVIPGNFPSAASPFTKQPSKPTSLQLMMRINA
ncbi:UNVERIFIED_CONTAM: Acetylajmalan esterase [Sesamum radiatum]|uniref:Acetylajmalan esterase n=1 Tax=Sesamum radiatum TaxID=300843 RepID=A0AAW2KIA2_SESRA